MSANVAPNQKDPGSQTHITAVRGLQTRRIGLWLALSFSTVTVITWTITCIQCYKPINFATYYDQKGTFTKSHYEINEWIRKVAKTAMSLLAAVSIPITSSVCAKAAAVYCQGNYNNPQRRLTMRQTLALADKGWSDLKILSNLIRPTGGCRIASFHLVVSMLVCSLGDVPIYKG